jgi:predicted RND superfamily exporter protein
VSFGLPPMAATDQARLIDRINALLRGTPAGVSAEPAGLVALSAASVTGLQGSRPWLMLLAAFAIFLLLVAARRRVSEALIALLPAVLGLGGAALLVRALGIRLSPLSAGLDPLVLALGVQFGLLLETRHDEAVRSVCAVAAVIGLGLAALVGSRFSALQQFGAIAAGEVAICALTAIVLVPVLAAACSLYRTQAPLTVLKDARSVLT